MSRQFVHPFQNDYVEFSVGTGGAANLDGGPQTTALLWKADSVTTNGLIYATNSGGFSAWAINPFSDNVIYFATAGFESTASYSSGKWYLSVFTKANGNSTLRVHTYDYTAATWTHTNYSSIGDSGNVPLTKIVLGQSGSGTGDRLDGKMAAAALWGSVLSDSDIETLNPGIYHWMQLSPLWCVKFDQASTATSVTDLTGNGGNQSAINGTAVSSDEPSPWSYSLSQTVHIGQVVETDIAQPITLQRRHAIGQVTETDIAQSVYRGFARIVNIGQPGEYDYASSGLRKATVIVDKTTPNMMVNLPTHLTPDVIVDKSIPHITVVI